jgi:hypothetical protein
VEPSNVRVLDAAADLVDKKSALLPPPPLAPGHRRLACTMSSLSAPHLQCLLGIFGDWSPRLGIIRYQGRASGGKESGEGAVHSPASGREQNWLQ